MVKPVPQIFNYSTPAPDDYVDERRRKFLYATGVTAGLWVVSKTQVAVAKACAELPEATVLSRHARCTLLQVAQRLFPHAGLTVDVYAGLVLALDRRASTDQSIAKLLNSGVQALDATGSAAWIDLAEGEQLAALRNIESSEFFELMRTGTLEYLYRDERVWQLLGFEGSSIEHGGYLERGFDDIDWLPKSGPSRDSSP